jgi:hypothetical protein
MSGFLRFLFCDGYHGSRRDPARRVLYWSNVGVVPFKQELLGPEVQVRMGGRLGGGARAL